MSTSDVAPALLVDLYELTMAHAYQQTGMASAPATFSLFVRTLPEDRSYLVAAGLDDALRWLEELRFGPEELAAIERLDLFPAEFLDHLAELRFTGTVRGVPEGTVVFAEEPLLEVDAPIEQAQLAETFLLNQLSVQTMLATTAARCRQAAEGRQVIDFAIRRTHGIDAAMKLARVSRLVGLTATSNVAGADRYGLPASGTMAHSFVQAHEDERQAFLDFAEIYRERTILLVDTYDTRLGVEHAIEVARTMRARGVEIAGIRLDSGDLAAQAHDARRRLDEAGFDDVRIYASGDLDEYRIQRLVRDEKAPIDGFGVGTSLGVSKAAPSLNAVYKLSCVGDRMVRKTSEGKVTWPGPKQVWRAEDWSEDVLALADEPAPSPSHRPLLVEVMRDGTRTEDGRRSLAAANEHFERGWGSLPGHLRHLTERSEHPVRISEGVRQAAQQADATRA